MKTLTLRDSYYLTDALGSVANLTAANGDTGTVGITV
jgi:hypothetical protein